MLVPASRTEQFHWLSTPDQKDALFTITIWKYGLHFQLWMAMNRFLYIFIDTLNTVPAF